MDTKLTRLESTLISILIFLIPTNLSYHFLSSHAFVHGILVDYLIPKIYISDIIVISLLIIWALKSHRSVRKKLSKFLNKPLSFLFGPKTLLLTTYCLLLLLSALLSHKQIPSLFFLIKLFEFTLLAIYLSTHLKITKTTRSRQNFARLLKKPLTATVTFQSLVAIFQWLQQKSVLGYLFLGETTLKNSSHIAKTGLTGTLRTLPYGTTPHPNVLAGFLVISLSVILIINKLYPTKSNYPNVKGRTFNVSFWLLALSALLLTQSLTAIAAFLFGLTLIYWPHLITKHWKKTLVAMTLFTSLLLYFFTSSSDTSDTFDTFGTSLSRRLRLNSIAIQMTRANPILGVGPLNFTARMTDYGEVQGTTRFLQPVHNIYLLFTSETGLLTTTILAFILYKHRNKLNIKHQTLNIPIILLLTVGLLDHYPLTLQSGQLLLTFSIALSLIPLNKP